MTIDREKLKALAEAATVGPWHARDYGSYDGKSAHWFVDTERPHDIVDDQDGGISPNHWDDARGERDMKFIAAANPATILGLIAEIERLDGCDKAYAEVWEKARGLQSEMDAVMAENEGLRKDAERYRFIRSYYTKFSVEIAIPGFESDWVTGDQADKEIDVAMSKEPDRA